MSSGGGGRTRGERYYLYDQELRRPPRHPPHPQHPHPYHSSSSHFSRRDYYRKDDPSRGHGHGQGGYRYDEGRVARNPPPPRPRSPIIKSRSRSRTRSRSKSPPHARSRSRTPPARPKSRSRSRTPPDTPSPEKEKKKEKEYDLSIQLEPLTEMVADPRKLLREAMNLLGTKRLNAMIPPALKTMGRRNLEFFCLEELESMEQGTLLNVLAGKESKNSPRDESNHRNRDRDTNPDGKSGGQDSGDANAVGKTAVKKFKTKLKKVLIQETETKHKEHKRKKKKSRDKDKSSANAGEEQSEGEEHVSPKKMKKSKKEKKKRSKKRDSSSSPTKVLPPLSVPTVIPGQKTLMELLELEYRAKAIKALLRTQGIDGSKIDSALSLDAPPLSPDAPPTPQVAVAAVPESSNTNPVEGDTSGSVSVVAVAVAPPPSPLMRSPDSSNVNLVPDPDPDLDPMTSPEQIDLCSPEHPEPCSSPEGEDDPEQVTSSIPGDNEKEEEEVEEGDPDHDDPESEEDEDEPEFVVEVKRVEETETEPEEPEPDPIPKEFEEGEIDSADETEAVDDADLDQGQGQIEDVFGEGDSSEEETAIWSKRVGGASDSSSSESNGGSPGRERRSWARDRMERRNGRKSRSRSPLSDVSQEAFEDSLSQDGDEVKVNEGSKPNDKDDIESLPEDTLERISSEGEGAGEEEDAEEKEEELEDLDALPIITEDGSIVFPAMSKEAESDPSRDEEDDEAETETGDGDGRGSEDEEDTPLTWYHRWYQSKKVQRQVKANKMYGSLRSKLRREKALPDPMVKVKGPAGPPVPEPEVSIPIIGSMEEYEKLFGKPKPIVVVLEEKKEGQSDQAPQNPEETVGGSDEEEEDDDDLWGDILGGN